MTDEVHEKDEARDAHDLLQEILQVQELILHRLEKLEDAVRAFGKK